MCERRDRRKENRSERHRPTEGAHRRRSVSGRLIIALVIIGSTVGAVVGITGAPARAASAPGLAIAKSASVSGYSAAGTVITYTYVVLNTGSTALPNVTVTDPMPGLSAINCGGNSNVIPSLAASCLGDLHGHLHDHPGRCGCRIHRPTQAPPTATVRAGNF